MLLQKATFLRNLDYDARLRTNELLKPDPAIY